MVTEGTQWTRVCNSSGTVFMLFLNDTECPDERAMNKSLRQQKSEAVAIKRDAKSPSSIYVDEDGMPAGRKYRSELFGAHKVYSRNKDFISLCEKQFRHFPELNSSVVHIDPVSGEKLPENQNEKGEATMGVKTGHGKGYQMCERIFAVEVLGNRFLVRYFSMVPYQARELFEKLSTGDAHVVAKEGPSRSDSGRTRWVYEDGTRRIPTKPPVHMKITAEDLVLQFVEHLDEYWADLLQPFRRVKASTAGAVEEASKPAVSPPHVVASPPVAPVISPYCGFRCYSLPKQTSWWG